MVDPQSIHLGGAVRTGVSPFSYSYMVTKDESLSGAGGAAARSAIVYPTLESLPDPNECAYGLMYQLRWPICPGEQYNQMWHDFTLYEQFKLLRITCIISRRATAQTTQAPYKVSWSRPHDHPTYTYEVLRSLKGVRTRFLKPGHRIVISWVPKFRDSALALDNVMQYTVADGSAGNLFHHQMVGKSWLTPPGRLRSFPWLSCQGVVKMFYTSAAGTGDSTGSMAWWENNISRFMVNNFVVGGPTVCIQSLWGGQPNAGTRYPAPMPLYIDDSTSTIQNGTDIELTFFVRAAFRGKIRRTQDVPQSTIFAFPGPLPVQVADQVGNANALPLTIVDAAADYFYVPAGTRSLSDTSSTSRIVPVNTVYGTDTAPDTFAGVRTNYPDHLIATSEFTQTNESTTLNS